MKNRPLGTTPPVLPLIRLGNAAAVDFLGEGYTPLGWPSNILASHDQPWPTVAHPDQPWLAQGKLWLDKGPPKANQ